MRACGTDLCEGEEGIYAQRRGHRSCHARGRAQIRHRHFQRRQPGEPEELSGRDLRDLRLLVQWGEVYPGAAADATATLEGRPEKVRHRFEYGMWRTLDVPSVGGRQLDGARKGAEETRVRGRASGRRAGTREEQTSGAKERCEIFRTLPPARVHRARERLRPCGDRRDHGDAHHHRAGKKDRVDQ